MKGEHPFTGGIMTCKKCGWSFKSNWSIESMWTAVSIDDTELMYFCPKCWGVPRHLWPIEVQKAYDNDHPIEGKKHGN